MDVSPDWAARLRTALRGATDAELSAPAATFTVGILARMGLDQAGVVGDFADPKSLVRTIAHYQAQQLKAKPTGLPQVKSQLNERDDLGKIAAIRSLVAGYPGHVVGGARALVAKYADPATAAAKGASTAALNGWDALTHYQGVKIELRPGNAEEDQGQYMPATQVVTIFDDPVFEVLYGLRKQLLALTGSTDPVKLPGIRRAAVKTCNTLAQADWNRFRNTFYHELVHQQDDAGGRFKKSFGNLTKQTLRQPDRARRVYINGPHETNARYLARVAEIMDQTTQPGYQLPARVQDFVADFIADDELYFNELTVPNKKAILKRVYDLYQQLKATQGASAVLTEDAEPAARLTADQPMYRFCSDDEIEMLVNGGEAGKFWLDRPYYGSEDKIYLKTTFGVLKTTDQSSYGGGSTMTASGRLNGADPYEIVAMRGGQEHPVSKEGYRWKEAPESMEPNDWYRGTSIVKQWVDEYALGTGGQPTMEVNFWRHLPESPYTVGRYEVDKYLARFMDFESACRFVARYKAGRIKRLNEGAFLLSDESRSNLSSALKPRDNWKKIMAGVKEPTRTLVLNGAEKIEGAQLVGVSAVLDKSYLREAGRCERNAYGLVKSMLNNGIEHYQMAVASLVMADYWVQHYLVYDSQALKFIEVTPVKNVVAYLARPLPQYNEYIKKATKYEHLPSLSEHNAQCWYLNKPEFQQPWVGDAEIIAASAVTEGYEGDEDEEETDKTIPIDVDTPQGHAWGSLDEDGIAELKIVETKPEFRRKGYGRKLVKAFVKKALASGAGVVRLQCEPVNGNPMSQQELYGYYEKLGFVKAGYSNWMEYRAPRRPLNMELYARP